jgi:hypothetical protein
VLRVLTRFALRVMGEGVNGARRDEANSNYWHAHKLHQCLRFC